MDYMRLKARAKINLALDVCGVRPDGYHEVRMVMQSIGLYDGIELKRTVKPGIHVSSNIPYFATSETNLAYRAAKLLMDEFPVEGGISIYLYKYIPVSAGLAGGSADAAAVLYGVNRIFRLDLSLEELCKRGVTLGADVPFCLMRGTVLAEGIGEKLTRQSACPDCFLIIAKPPINVSTKMVYQAIDETHVETHPDIDGMIAAIDKGDLNGVIARMGNVMENVTIPMYPVIDEIKKSLMENGALGAMMSGSGPTVFGMFETEEKAGAAFSELKKSHLAAQVYLTNMYQERKFRENAGR